MHVDLRNAGRLMVSFWLITETATKCEKQSQVSVSITNTWVGQQVKLTCNTDCNLFGNPTYVWYINGHNRNTFTSKSQVVEGYLTDSYSCAVKDHEDLRSPTVCVPGQSCFDVSYTHQNICVLKGTTVDLPCTYRYPASLNVLEANWYIQDKPNAAPTNLSLVSGYADRVELVGTKDKDCTLRITDLRESDSAEYKFSFKTQYGDWGFSFSGTTLTVTDLQVKVTHASEGSNAILTCTTSCILTDKPIFIWFKSGQILTTKTSQEISVMSYYTYSYSCAVKGHDNLRSPTVCVLGHSCFDVTYTHQSICALKGLTVDLLCTYQYPRTQNLSEASWYIQKNPNGALTTLSLFSGYTNRVAFDTTKDKDCTLRITDLRESDSAEYKFRFKTRYGDWGFSFPGTTLTVTDLKVKLSPASEEGNVTLICSTTCTQTDKPTFIWYKNRQRITNPKILDNLLYLDSFSSEDAGSYTCAVKAGEKEVRSPALTVGEHTPGMKAGLGITVGLILLVCLSGFLWFRKKVHLFVSTRSTSYTQNTAEKCQEDSNPVYENITRRAMIPTVPQTSDEEDGNLYANIPFSCSKKQDMDVYSTVQLAELHIPDKDEQDDGYYGNINFTGFKNQDVLLYSVVQLPQPQIPDEDDESCYVDAYSP